MTNLLSRRNNNSPNQNNCQRDNSNNSNENIKRLTCFIKLNKYLMGFRIA